MKASKYIVTIVDGLASNSYQTDSRDSVKHLRNHGGNKAIVETRTGKTVSVAERDEKNNPVRCTF